MTTPGVGCGVVQGVYVRRIMQPCARWLVRVHCTSRGPISSLPSRSCNSSCITTGLTRRQSAVCCDRRPSLERRRQRRGPRDCLPSWWGPRCKPECFMPRISQYGAQDDVRTNRHSTRVVDPVDPLAAARWQAPRPRSGAFGSTVNCRVVYRNHALPLLCRFSYAGSDDPSTRSGGRRLKSAKARNRGKWGTVGAAGSMGI
jgi:hypothetical protein